MERDGHADFQQLALVDPQRKISSVGFFIFSSNHKENQTWILLLFIVIIINLVLHNVVGIILEMGLHYTKI